MSKKKETYKHYEEITFLVKYFADGVIHYCHPNTSELLFERKTPTSQSPIVEIDLATQPSNTEEKK